MRDGDRQFVLLRTFCPVRIAARLLAGLYDRVPLNRHGERASHSASRIEGGTVRAPPEPPRDAAKAASFADTRARNTSSSSGGDLGNYWAMVTHRLTRMGQADPIPHLEQGVF